MNAKWEIRRVTDSIGTIWNEVFNEDGIYYRFTDKACAERFANDLNRKEGKDETD